MKALIQNINFKYCLLLISVVAFPTISAAQTYDTLEDLRDGNVYLTIKIGEQHWMAENLNYQIKRGSSCYGDEKQNCSIYGRLYSWDVADTVCPDGWHASTQKDWQTLIDYYGGADSAGMHLKLKSRLWNNQNPMDDNSSGFSAIPGGKRNHLNHSQSLGYYAYFWIANYSGEFAWCAYISCTGKNVEFTSIPIVSGLSIRCVKN